MIAVVDDSKEVETAVSAGAGDGAEERSQTDKLVDGMDFGELCNDFECISSPYVEATARQLARDILDLRDDNRAFTCYAVSVKYKVCPSHFATSILLLILSVTYWRTPYISLARANAFHLLSSSETVANRHCLYCFWNWNDRSSAF